MTNKKGDGRWQGETTSRHELKKIPHRENKKRKKKNWAKNRLHLMEVGLGAQTDQADWQGNCNRWSGRDREKNNSPSLSKQVMGKQTRDCPRVFHRSKKKVLFQKRNGQKVTSRPTPHERKKKVDFPSGGKVSPITLPRIQGIDNTVQDPQQKSGRENAEIWVE